MTDQILRTHCVVPTNDGCSCSISATASKPAAFRCSRRTDTYVGTSFLPARTATASDKTHLGTGLECGLSRGQGFRRYMYLPMAQKEDLES